MVLEFALTEPNGLGIGEHINGVVTDNNTLLQDFLKKHSYTHEDISEYLHAPVGIITSLSVSKELKTGMCGRRLMFSALDTIAELAPVDYIFAICPKATLANKAVLNWYLSFGFNIVAEVGDSPLLMLEY